MLKFILLAFLSLMANTQFHAQGSYRSGFIIDNSGERLEAEIRERDWTSNPTNLTYRLAGSTNEQQAGITDLAGFGLYDDVQHFVRAGVAIEQSSDALATLSTSPLPEFNTDTVWLRQLIDGEADLFYWVNERYTRFFFRLGDGNIEPLVYRRFREDRVGIRIDERYRVTLASTLNCEGGDLPNVKYVDYTQRSLIKYFTAYNACIQAPQSIYTDPKGPAPRLAIRVGGEFRKPVYDGILGFSGEIASKILPTFGVEIEQPLQFTNRRWSIFVGLNYRSHQQVAEQPSAFFFIDSRSLEVPLGARVNLLEFAKNKVFLLGAAVTDLPIGESVFRRSKNLVYEMGFNFGATFGAGIRIGGHLEIEGRYRLKHEILKNYLSASLKDQGFALTAAYRL